MKKIITTLVAGAMMFGFTAPTFAAINPANIDESSSRDNIYKIVWEDVSEGTNAGVVSIFAWAHIDGKIYSVALADLRKHGNPSKAFADIVGAELAVDQAANLVGALETRVSDNNGQIVEIVERIVTKTIEVPGPTVTIDNTDHTTIGMLRDQVRDLQSDNVALEALIGTYNPVAGEEWTHREFLNNFLGYYADYVANNGAAALPEDTFRGLTGSLVNIVDNLYLEITRLTTELTAIETQLELIKSQIDRAGEVDASLGLASSVDWGTLTVLEKATRIAEKLPEIVQVFSDNEAAIKAVEMVLPTGVELGLGLDASLTDRVEELNTRLASQTARANSLTNDRYNAYSEVATAIGGDIAADYNNDLAGPTQVLAAVSDLVADAAAYTAFEASLTSETGNWFDVLTDRYINDETGELTGNASDWLQAIWDNGANSRSFAFADRDAAMNDPDSLYHAQPDLTASKQGYDIATGWTGEASLLTLSEDIRNAIERELEESYSDGFDDGFDAGYEVGYEDGFADGRKAE